MGYFNLQNVLFFRTNSSPFNLLKTGVDVQQQNFFPFLTPGQQIDVAPAPASTQY
jgi:hypothetical protein